jgi:catalase-peroxidase
MRGLAGDATARRLAEYITTSDIEGAWSNNPTKWTSDYPAPAVQNYDYELTESPTGAKRWHQSTGTGTMTTRD